MRNDIDNSPRLEASHGKDKRNLLPELRKMVEWKDKESFFEQGFDNRVFIIPAIIIILIIAFAAYKLYSSVTSRERARKEKAQKKKERKDQKKKK